MTIDPDRRRELSAVVVLSEMVDASRDYPLVLEAADEALEPVLEWLHSRDYVQIVDDERYSVTAKGRKALERFMARYRDFVSTMEVYSAVDLDEGTFAYERFFDFETDADFADYLNDERWDDLRVAVAELKRIDPVEVVFMSMLQEDRIGVEGSEPGNTLLEGAHWDEIEEIVATALSSDELEFEDEDGRVTGEEVLKRIIVEGAELNIELKRHEAELEREQGGSGGDDAAAGDRRRGEPEGDVVEQYTVEHYEPYLDPSYVSPVWAGVWLI